MPTVLYINGYRFYFYAGDGNEPAHVHVEKGDGTAKVWLEPKLLARYYYNFKPKERKEIMELARNNYDFLKSKWYEYFQK